MSTRCWLAAISFVQCDAPYDECAHWTMAFALAEAGRLEEALYACDAGISLNPNNSLLLADKGDYLGALGERKRLSRHAVSPFSSTRATRSTTGGRTASQAPDSSEASMRKH